LHDALELASCNHRFRTHDWQENRRGKRTTVEQATGGATPHCDCCIHRREEKPAAVGWMDVLLCSAAERQVVLRPGCACLRPATTPLLPPSSVAAACSCSCTARRFRFDRLQAPAASKLATYLSAHPIHPFVQSSVVNELYNTIVGSVRDASPCPDSNSILVYNVSWPATSKLACLLVVAASSIAN
jgi:hypothetical protein